MSKPQKQIHPAAHFPGVNNTSVWSDPRSGSHIEFGSFKDDLLILPAATFALADTDDEPEELAKEVRRQPVGGAIARKHLEFVWNRDLSSYDPEGPLPDIAPTCLDAFADKVVPLLQEQGVFRTDYEGPTLRHHLGLALPHSRLRLSGGTLMDDLRGEERVAS